MVGVGLCTRGGRQQEYSLGDGMSVDWWWHLLNNLGIHYLLSHNLILHYLMWCENVRRIDFLRASCSASVRTAPKLPAAIDSTQSRMATAQGATVDTADGTVILDFGPEMLCSVLEVDVLPSHAWALGLGQSRVLVRSSRMNLNYATPLWGTAIDPHPLSGCSLLLLDGSLVVGMNILLYIHTDIYCSKTDIHTECT